jgi:hypothetical protein
MAGGDPAALHAALSLTVTLTMGIILLTMAIRRGRFRPLVWRR